MYVHIFNSRFLKRNMFREFANPSYIKSTLHFQLPWLAYNYQLYKICQLNKHLWTPWIGTAKMSCFSLQLHEEVCLKSKLRLIKTVRIRLADIEGI